MLSFTRSASFLKGKTLAALGHRSPAFKVNQACKTLIPIRAIFTSSTNTLHSFAITSLSSRPRNVNTLPSPVSKWHQITPSLSRSFRYCSRSSLIKSSASRISLSFVKDCPLTSSILSSTVNSLPLHFRQFFTSRFSSKSNENPSNQQQQEHPDQTSTSNSYSPTSNFFSYDDQVRGDALLAIVVDSFGNSTQRTFSRYELTRLFSLHPRDIRFLDSSLRNMPSILARRKVIIVNLEMFKAIITRDALYIFDSFYPHTQGMIPALKHLLSSNATSMQMSYAAMRETEEDTEEKRNGYDDSSPPSIKSSDKSETQSSRKDVDSMTFDNTSGERSRTKSAPPSTSATSSTNRASFSPPEADMHDHNDVLQRLPFEFICLEYILTTVCRNLENRFELYTATLSPLISTTPPFIPAQSNGSTLMQLLQLKNGLTSFEVVLRETSIAIRDVLSDEKDLNEMYLSGKQAHVLPMESKTNISLVPAQSLPSFSSTPNLGNSPHHSPSMHSKELSGRRLQHTVEIELLLETYMRKVEELENEVQISVKLITLTEEHIQIRLDSARNSMMRLDLLFSIATLGLTFGAMLASMYGMNLRNELETVPFGAYFFMFSFAMLGFLIFRRAIAHCRRHKIDLFHIEPDEPALNLPPPFLGKHKIRYKESTEADMFMKNASDISSGANANMAAHWQNFHANPSDHFEQGWLQRDLSHSFQGSDDRLGRSADIRVDSRRDRPYFGRLASNNRRSSY